MRRRLSVLLLAVLITAAAHGQTRGEWGDQGDGTYANPVMPGDFSDLDAIRVGADYYAFTSTFQYSPGVAILHSRDLVNWEIAGHAVPDLTALDRELNWDRMGRAGRGVWAGAIRFHQGRFWVYFGTPDQGILMTTAAQVAGPWTPPKLVLDAPGWDDPCPFWDDDGQGYLVATHFAPEGPAATPYNIHVFKMNAAGDALLPGTDRVIHHSKGSEANKLDKIDGRYFHYFSEVRPEGRVPMMERAASLNGPWEIRQLMHVHPKIDKEPNQGGLVQLPSGAWAFLTHQGTGDWEGRAGVLLPVTWIDGWPIPGHVGPDGIGNMVWTAKMPVTGFPRTTLAASDDFASPTLKPEWEWNYQPRADHWSLTEHPGHLRLRAFAPLRPDDIRATGNVLTQRAFRTRENQVTAKLDLSGMVDGQEAGLAHYGKTSCTLSIVREAGVRRLSDHANGTKTPGPVLPGTVIYLRSTWGFDGLSRFSYSTDGRTYLPFGDPCQLTWGDYRGDRIGLFTVNPTADAGYLDVDSFDYTIAR